MADKADDAGCEDADANAGLAEALFPDGAKTERRERDEIVTCHAEDHDAERLAVGKDIAADHALHELKERVDKCRADAPARAAFDGEQQEREHREQGDRTAERHSPDLDEGQRDGKCEHDGGFGKLPYFCVSHRRNTSEKIKFRTDDMSVRKQA